MNLWLALDDIGPERGCLQYIPGSHRRGVRPHNADGPPFILDYGDCDRDQEVAVPALAGDVIIHDGLTVHCSGNNSTALERPALVFPYSVESGGGVAPRSLVFQA